MMQMTIMNDLYHREVRTVEKIKLDDNFNVNVKVAQLLIESNGMELEYLGNTH